MHSRSLTHHQRCWVTNPQLMRSIRLAFASLIFCANATLTFYFGDGFASKCVVYELYYWLIEYGSKARGGVGTK